jgi:hypothetical protein
MSQCLEGVSLAAPEHWEKGIGQWAASSCTDELAFLKDDQTKGE